MNCSECQEHFSELHDGKSPARAAAAARAHLGACPSCSAGYRDFGRALAALGAEPLERVPVGFEEEVLGRLLAGEAAVSRGPRPEFRPDSRRRAARFLAAAGALAAAAILCAFLVGRFVGGVGGRVDSRLSTVDSEAASLRQDLSRLAAVLEQVRAEAKDREARVRSEAKTREAQVRAEADAKEARVRGEMEARAAEVRAREEEWTRRVREIEESLSRKRSEYEVLEKEKRALGESLARLEADRDALAALVEDLRRPPAPPPPKKAVPPDPPQPQLVGAPPVLPERPAAVAFDRRRGEEGDLSIDLRGPDSRVVPGLIALALSDDDELGNLALGLLRERVGGLPPGPPEDPSEAAPPRAFLQNVGTWLGEAWGIGPRSEKAERPLPAEERRREVQKIEEFWRARQAGAEAPGEKL